MYKSYVSACVHVTGSGYECKRAGGQGERAETVNVHVTMCVRACGQACVQAGRHACRRAGMRAGGQACVQAGRQVGRRAGRWAGGLLHAFACAHATASFEWRVYKCAYAVCVHVPCVCMCRVCACAHAVFRISPTPSSNPPQLAVRPQTAHAPCTRTADQ
eukprot:365381-Chlamydomonas_euryale.AAC.7